MSDLQPGDRVRLTGADWGPSLRGKVVTIEFIDKVDGLPVFLDEHGDDWAVFEDSPYDFTAERVSSQDS